MISSQKQFEFSSKMNPLFVLTQEQKQALSSYMKRDEAETKRVEEILEKSKTFELEMLKKMVEKKPALFAEVKKLAQTHIEKHRKLISEKNNQTVKQLKKTEVMSKKSDELVLESLEKDLNDLFE
jgi:hypothetical protein